MNWIFSNDAPIYAQLIEQIKAAIVSGQLKEGDMLPSMRMLAKELHISIITTKRAYEELERGGFIQTVAGKGCFVAPKNLEFVREMHLKELEDALARAAELTKMCNISHREARDMLDMFLKGDLYE